MPLRMSTAASAPPRAGVLDPDEQRVIEEARVRRLQRLARRELWSLAVFTSAFVASASALVLYLPSVRHPGLAAVLVLIGAYAAAVRLRLAARSGTAVPTGRL